VILRNTSASQVTAWNRCARYYFFRYVEKIATPKRQAQERGTNIHSELEHYIETGITRPSEWSKYVDAAKPFLPTLSESGVVAEKEFRLPTFDGGPVWVGYKDLEIRAEKVVRIFDYKTTSDFRYAKTPAELATDVQMSTYAHEAWLSHDGVDRVEVGHLYLLTKNKTPKTLFVLADIPKRTAAEQWQRDLAVVKQTVDAAACITNGEDLPPNTSACGMYGGCDFRARCGLTPTIRTKQERPMGESFMDRLKASAGVNGATTVAAVAQASAFDLKVAELMKLGLPQAAAENAAKIALTEAARMTAPPSTVPGGLSGTQIEKTVEIVPPAVPSAVGVLSPDAASRETVSITAATPPKSAEVSSGVGETEAPKRGRGRPKKADQAATSVADPVVVASSDIAQTTPDVTESPKPTPGAFEERPLHIQVTTTTRRPLTLYIDCYPQKGEPDVTSFEDWITPMCERVAVANEVPHWQLVKFAQVADGLLASEIRARIDQVPPVLHINSGSRAVSVALEVLRPYATRIVCGR
jgi:RecB family exonuclease